MTGKENAKRKHERKHEKKTGKRKGKEPKETIEELEQIGYTFFIS
jgi:hypothetical protein